MDWKHEAVEKLRKYDAMRAAVISIPQEIRCLQLADYELRRHNKSGGRKARIREDKLLNNAATRNELQWKLRQTQMWLDNTDRAMGCLSSQERQILNHLYVRPDRGGIDYLCGELNLEKSSVYRHRDQALSRFATALYGT